ncbi:HPr kinase/phosphorylase [Devosia sp.]|uniref:HPr kinase/phosphorylase n=1 Tax=Devosia sp. TaxID=1871048 RepID=UPI0035AE1D70
MSETQNIHATALVLGGIGLILRGPSGAGKSLLALELIDEWEARGLGGRLVSDDRVDVVRSDKGLWLQAPRSIAGLIELRGRGIVKRPHVEQAPLDLVIDLVETMDRMVEEDALSTELLGVRVARAPVPRAGVVDARHQLLLIREAVRALPPRRRGTRQKTT